MCVPVCWESCLIIMYMQIHWALFTGLYYRLKVEYGFNLCILYGDSGPPGNSVNPELNGNLSCSLELFALSKNIAGIARETLVTMQRASQSASREVFLGMSNNNVRPKENGQTVLGR